MDIALHGSCGILVFTEISTSAVINEKGIEPPIKNRELIQKSIFVFAWHTYYITSYLICKVLSEHKYMQNKKRYRDVFSVALINLS